MSSNDPNKTRIFEQRQKSQSAMEYLMTYGWSILIISIVLSAIFYIVLFGTSASAPMSQPGTQCQVYRPGGPYSTQPLIDLVGVCNQMPEYVAQFTTGVSGINANYINLGNPSSLQIIGSMTIAMWVYPKSFAVTQNIWCKAYGGEGCIDQDTTGWGYGPGTLEFLWGTAGGDTTPYQNYEAPASSTLNLDAWNFISITRNLQTMKLTWYINGQQITPLSAAYPNAVVSTYNSEIGGGYERTYNCSIADVQIYNTSLSSSEVQALYMEGIGGAPVQLQNLVGWWPLNGNPNDYSGDGLSGTPTKGVFYTSQWANGYTPP